MSDSKLDADTKSKIKELFDKYDSKKTGSLDKDDFKGSFRELLKWLDDESSDEEINKIVDEGMQQYDFNKNGLIELSEFTEVVIFLMNERGLNLFHHN